MAKRMRLRITHYFQIILILFKIIFLCFSKIIYRCSSIVKHSFNYLPSTLTVQGAFAVPWSFSALMIYRPWSGRTESRTRS